MEIALKLQGDEINTAQLEILIKLLSLQKATISLLCDKHSKTQDESDELYRLVVDEANVYVKEILEDLYERRGKIDINDILPKK